MNPKIPGKRVVCILTFEEIEKIDAIGEKFSMTRSDTLRAMIGVGLDAYEMYDRVGLVKLAEITKRARRALKKDVQPMLFE